MTFLAKMTVGLALAFMTGAMGCGGGMPVGTFENIPPPPPPPSVSYAQPDQVILKEALEGKSLSPEEVAELSDRLLIEGSPTFHDEQTMARLDMLLNRSLKGEKSKHQAKLMRNLGIIHYHQKKYNLARQELQRSNEINPRDARTHFYLARIYAQRGEYYQRQGKQKKSRGQFKLSAMELGLARKLEPSNSLYQQDLKQILRQDQGR